MGESFQGSHAEYPFPRLAASLTWRAILGYTHQRNSLNCFYHSCNRLVTEFCEISRLFCACLLLKDGPSLVFSSDLAQFANVRDKKFGFFGLRQWLVSRAMRKEYMMSQYVIETEGLTVYYGRHLGITGVNLQVEKGEVFGFLGPNGAGKTTTQRVLLDVIRPTAGKARMFGLDCQKEGVKARKRVGYLPGELSLYDNMRARDFFRMYNSMLGADAERDHWKILAERLNLDTSRKIREFSRGNKQKVGVVTAFMNRRELLVLDEPTTGLDPLVQQSVLEMVNEAKRKGSTVFFSTHILPEAQAVCDRVGIIRGGKLVATERVEDLTRQQFKRMRITFTRMMPPADTFDLPGVTETKRDHCSVELEIHENLQNILEVALPFGIQDIDTIPVTLEEIFLAYYGKNDGGNYV